MPGWSRLAAASASVWNRLTSVVVGELAGEDHLERDRPIEAHLPGLEDDAHAAAGDLADDLVVAEIANAGGRGGFADFSSRSRASGSAADRPARRQPRPGSPPMWMLAGPPVGLEAAANGVDLADR